MVDLKYTKINICSFAIGSKYGLQVIVGYGSFCRRDIDEKWCGDVSCGRYHVPYFKKITIKKSRSIGDDDRICGNFRRSVH